MIVRTHFAELPLPSGGTTRKGARALKVDDNAVRRLANVRWLARPINEIYQAIPLLAAPSKVHAA